MVRETNIIIWEVGGKEETDMERQKERETETEKDTERLFGFPQPALGTCPQDLKTCLPKVQLYLDTLGIKSLTHRCLGVSHMNYTKLFKFALSLLIFPSIIDSGVLIFDVYLLLVLLIISLSTSLFREYLLYVSVCPNMFPS